MGLLGDFMEGRQEASNNLNSWMNEALDGLLGPTGIPDRLRAANLFLNPAVNVDQAQRHTRTALDPSVRGADRALAIGQGLLEVGGLAIPAIASRITPRLPGQNLGDEAARAMTETFANVSSRPEAAALRDFGAGEAGALNYSRRASDYSSGHTAPLRDGYSAPLSELNGDIYPDDIYSANAVQYYGTGERALDRKTVGILQRFKGKPDADVSIYRAVPKGETDINAGDWVTINKDYAKAHGDSWLEGDYDIVEETVKAGDLFTDGNSIHEFGWSPSSEAVVARSNPVAVAKAAWEANPNSDVLRKEYLKVRNAPQSGLLGDAPKGIRAYHGSPHDFDEFRMDRIGTGEGAQAYGHGLYFADNEDVARSYRDALSGHSGQVKDAIEKMDTLLSDNNIAVPAHQMFGPGSTWDFGAIRRALPEGKQAEFDEIVQIAHKPPGRMYEVNIDANPEDFLDWDKPLSEQSEAVRGAFSDTKPPNELRMQSAKEIYGTDNPWLVQDADAVTRVNEAAREKMVGQDAYWMDKSAGQQGAVEGRLKDAGIPGIKYLDQGSRGAGQGTNNYVVFDENLISIIKKYGIAGAAAMLGMSAEDLQAQAESAMPEPQGLL